MDVRKESPYEFVIPRQGKMRVPVRIFADEAILSKMQQDESLTQACNVASLPGIVGESIVMPDAHQGYGFSIGGVAAFDMEEGIISPGGIGFDINCGVRLLATSLTADQVRPKMRELLDLLYTACPVGVGAEGVRLAPQDLKDISREGARWAVAHGYGTEEDLARCEAGGCLPEADPGMVPQSAMARGKDQLGTVGSGNHFVEVQVVDRITIPTVARTFGILHEGQVVIMIHCGSRGFGHQICTEYIRLMERHLPEMAKEIPDRNLVYAPLGSPLATKYWGAMNAAANYAFANRHILGHNVRKAFQELFPGCEVSTVYDVCHNIAKRERHVINGVEKEVLVHRKGATRAFPAGSLDIPAAYGAVGQPVLIPGSMGTASYVLVGAQDAMERSFGSTAHGAGRTMSRTRAKAEYSPDMVKAQLAKAGVSIKAATLKGISEEAPDAYKDVDAVVEVSHAAGIAHIVARLTPLGVIKG